MLSLVLRFLTPILSITKVQGRTIGAIIFINWKDINYFEYCFIFFLNQFFSEKYLLSSCKPIIIAKFMTTKMKITVLLGMKSEETYISNALELLTFSSLKGGIEI